MASFILVQRPTETPNLTNVNQTIQGAEHPIATQFVENVIQAAKMKIRNENIRQDTLRFRQQREEFTLQPTIFNARIMGEERGMMLGGFRPKFFNRN